MEDGNLKVSCFTRTDKIGSQWSFPEEADLQSTSVDQVLCKVDNVRYQCIIGVCCFTNNQVWQQNLTKSFLKSIENLVYNKLTLILLTEH